MTIQELRKSERRLKYMSKKVCCILFGMLLVTGVIVCIKNNYSSWTVAHTRLMIVMAVLMAWDIRWINTYMLKLYMCVPYISRYMGREKVRDLLADVEFRQVEELKGTYWEDKVFLGTNWMKVNDCYIATNLIVGFWKRISSQDSGASLELWVLYLTGDRVRVRLGPASRSPEMGKLNITIYEKAKGIKVWPPGDKILKLCCKEFRSAIKERLQEPGYLEQLISTESQLKSEYIKKLPKLLKSRPMDVYFH